MSNIPKARKLLEEALAYHSKEARLIRRALKEMTRETGPRTPVKHHAIPKADHSRVVEMHNKGMNNAEIAHHFKTNQGRVSEVLKQYL